MRHLALPFYCAVVVFLLLALLARVIYTDAGSLLPPVLFGIGYFAWRGIKDARQSWPEFKADRQRDADRRRREAQRNRHPITDTDY
ncbi:hypothetical protein [uncultured Stenotrophomonas sp.]|uniref:hypothetical protein n=1 Tax=uncultured Stenotrophomonas sp. TaxID=165438 RepID=UPI002589041B|nr:hypothetical protein [uncultured Stenotrophomonas sp.]